jgi:hypothetical protein
MPEYLSRMDVAALPDGSVFVTDVRGRGEATDVRAARVHLPGLHVEQVEAGADGNALPVSMIYHKLAVVLPQDHQSLPDDLLYQENAASLPAGENALGGGDGPEAADAMGDSQSPVVESRGPLKALEHELEKADFGINTLEEDGDELVYDVYHDDFSKVKAVGGNSDTATYDGENNRVSKDDVGALIDEVRAA